jgi:hypothetical protein
VLFWCEIQLSVCSERWAEVTPSYREILNDGNSPASFSESIF